MRFSRNTFFDLFKWFSTESTAKLIVSRHNFLLFCIIENKVSFNLYQFLRLCQVPFHNLEGKYRFFESLVLQLFFGKYICFPITKTQTNFYSSWYKGVKKTCLEATTSDLFFLELLHGKKRYLKTTSLVWFWHAVQRELKSFPMPSKFSNVFCTISFRMISSWLPWRTAFP